MLGLPDEVLLRVLWYVYKQHRKALENVGLTCKSLGILVIRIKCLTSAFSVNTGRLLGLDNPVVFENLLRLHLRRSSSWSSHKIGSVYVPIVKFQKLRIVRLSTNNPDFLLMFQYLPPTVICVNINVEASSLVFNSCKIVTTVADSVDYRQIHDLNIKYLLIIATKPLYSSKTHHFFRKLLVLATRASTGLDISHSVPPIVSTVAFKKERNIFFRTLLQMLICMGPLTVLQLGNIDMYQLFVEPVTLPCDLLILNIGALHNYHLWENRTRGPTIAVLDTEHAMHIVKVSDIPQATVPLTLDNIGNRLQNHLSRAANPTLN